MSVKEFDVITVGDVFIDIVMTGFDHWPRPGEESFAKALHREAGGGAAITACGLAKLEMKTAIFAIVGRDGDWLTKRLAQRGVSLELVSSLENESMALTVSVSSAEDRTFFTYQGSNNFLPDALKEEEVLIRQLSRARHVHLAFGIDPDLLIRVASGLHANQTTISIDIGWQTEWMKNERTMSALKHADLFMPNESEGQFMTGMSRPEDILKTFGDLGLNHIALKLGDQGSALLRDGAVFNSPAVKVSAVDTTGAGDCFDAGYIYAWIKGYSPETCLRFGNICGAFSTQSYGGIEGFPARDDLQI
jgi:sugar/nucleoside kinase (ribokinase family)